MKNKIYGINVPMAERVILGANPMQVVVSTNGYHGGDGAHGSVTGIYFKWTSICASELDVYANGVSDDDGYNVGITFRGDSELRTMIMALRSAANMLEELTLEGSDPDDK